VARVQYRAFLSYSHRDAKWADWLHKALETYRPPKTLIGTTTALGPVPKRLIPIFRDREELASATELGAVINAALEDSACQIVICSPDAAKSRWVNAEILAFKRLARADRIFPLIVSGEPNASAVAGREAEECFPPALRFHLGPDGELSDARTEPVAADARPGKDGKNRAKLKLVAAVLGVGFDILRRREQQRRARQLFIAACAATCGMVLTSGLATYALIQRSIAQKQTARAEKEADAARQTTNFLIGLFRLADPSEARGNTVTAREMLDKAAVSVDAELAKQPAIQVPVLQTLGTVYTGLGLYREAQPLLNRSLAMARGLPDTEVVALSEGLNDLAACRICRPTTRRPSRPIAKPSPAWVRTRRIGAAGSAWRTVCMVWETCCAARATTRMRRAASAMRWRCSAGSTARSTATSPAHSSISR